MPLAVLLLGLMAARCVLGADTPVPRDAPNYSAAGIVNAADNQSGALAPNTIGTIYGVNMAFGTGTLTGDALETILGDCETRVFVAGYAADLYYVSPGQINFLVPPMLLPGPASVYIVVNSLTGPSVHLTLAPAAPGLFPLYLPQSNIQYTVASRVDGSVLKPASPAKPGDIVMLWATGLGATVPPTNYGQLPSTAAPLVAGANLQILLDGTAVDPGAIEYAGVAPGYAGLYQINLRLPKSTGLDPEIRLVMGSASSIPGVHLPVSPVSP